MDTNTPFHDDSISYSAKKLWPLTLFFLWPLANLLLGWGDLELGTRAFRSTPWSSCLVQAALFFVVVFAGLVWPLSQSLWGTGKYSRGFCLLVSTVLLSLPLVGYSYFLSGASRADEWHEILMTIVPSVVMATLIYDRTRNVALWAAALSVCVFFSSFLINEILGPYPTYFSLTPNQNRYVFVRILFPLLSVLTLTWVWYRKEITNRGLGNLLAAVAVHGLLVHLGAPLGKRALTGQWAIVSFEQTWVLTLPLIVGLYRGKPLKGFAGVLLLVNLGAAAYRVYLGQTGVFDLQAFLQNLLAIGVLTLVLSHHPER